MNNRTRRTESGFERARRQGGIGIDTAEALLGDASLDALDMADRMHTGDLLAAGARRLDTLQKRKFFRFERAKHGTQPIRAFRVAGRRLMFQAGGMG